MLKVKKSQQQQRFISLIRLVDETNMQPTTRPMEKWCRLPCVTGARQFLLNIIYSYKFYDTQKWRHNTNITNRLFDTNDGSHSKKQIHEKWMWRIEWRKKHHTKQCQKRSEKNVSGKKSLRAQCNLRAHDERIKSTWMQFHFFLQTSRKKRNRRTLFMFVLFTAVFGQTQWSGNVNNRKTKILTQLKHDKRERKKGLPGHICR